MSAAEHDASATARDAERKRRTAPFGEVVSLRGGEVRICGHLGLIEVDGGVRPIRLPEAAWRHFPPRSDMLRAIVSRPSGVRLRIRTTARNLRLQVRCTRLAFPDWLGQVNAFVASVEGVDVSTVPTPVDAVETFDADGHALGMHRERDSSVLAFTLPPGDKVLELWLPQMVMVDLLSIDADGPVEAADSAQRPVWVHYGSSISHGAEAMTPTSPWPVVAARLTGVDVVNLGLAGQCHLDPFVAEAIAATPADVISLKIGINIVGARSMDQRTFVPAVHGFLDRIRVGHPDTPVVIVSPILWPGHEDVTGPTVRENRGGSGWFRPTGTVEQVAAGALSLSVVRDQLRQVASQRATDGESVLFLDGHALYGEGDTARWPLPDGLHPDTDLSHEIGRRFARLVFSEAGLVAASGLSRASAAPHNRSRPI